MMRLDGFRVRDFVAPRNDDGGQLPDLTHATAGFLTFFPSARFRTIT
jgi:hypothetical protein